MIQVLQRSWAMYFHELQFTLKTNLNKGKYASYCFWCQLLRKSLNTKQLLNNPSSKTGNYVKQIQAEKKIELLIFVKFLRTLNL